VKPEEEEPFDAFLMNLRELGYTYHNETENPIYHSFLLGENGL
jgi:hypothetical protein